MSSIQQARLQQVSSSPDSLSSVPISALAWPDGARRSSRDVLSFARTLSHGAAYGPFQYCIDCRGRFVLLMLADSCRLLLFVVISNFVVHLLALLVSDVVGSRICNSPDLPHFLFYWLTLAPLGSLHPALLCSLFLCLPVVSVQPFRPAVSATLPFRFLSAGPSVTKLACTRGLSPCPPPMVHLLWSPSQLT